MTDLDQQLVKLNETFAELERSRIAVVAVFAAAIVEVFKSGNLLPKSRDAISHTLGVDPVEIVNSDNRVETLTQILNNKEYSTIVRVFTLLITAFSENNEFITQAFDNHKKQYIKYAQEYAEYNEAVFTQNAELANYAQRLNNENSLILHNLIPGMINYNQNRPENLRKATREFLESKIKELLSEGTLVILLKSFLENLNINLLKTDAITIRTELANQLRSYLILEINSDEARGYAQEKYKVEESILKADYITDEVLQQEFLHIATEDFLFIESRVKVDKSDHTSGEDVNELPELLGLQNSLYCHLRSAEVRPKIDEMFLNSFGIREQIQYWDAHSDHYIETEMKAYLGHLITEKYKDNSFLAIISEYGIINNFEDGFFRNYAEKVGVDYGEIVNKVGLKVVQNFILQEYLTVFSQNLIAQLQKSYATFYNHSIGENLEINQVEDFDNGNRPLSPIPPNLDENINRSLELEQSESNIFTDTFENGFASSFSNIVEELKPLYDYKNSTEEIKESSPDELYSIRKNKIILDFRTVIKNKILSCINILELDRDTSINSQFKDTINAENDYNEKLIIEFKYTTAKSNILKKLYHIIDSKVEENETLLDKFAQNYFVFFEGLNK